jgi:hypothetical protein
MVYSLVLLSSNSLICPEHITTISSLPYEIRWKNSNIDFSQRLTEQKDFPSFEAALKICSPNAYVKLIDFVELQDRITSERKNTSAWKHWRSKKKWEAELSFSYYELWINYEQDTKIPLQWGESRVRGGLVSTAQGSDLITDYLYALFSKSWDRYELKNID